MFRRRPIPRVVVTLVFIVLAPASEADGISENTACPTAEVVGLTVGDLVSCLASEPEREDPDPFEPLPGEDYSGLYGPEPERLPVPERCDTPVAGSYTQDQGVITTVSQRGGRTILTGTYNTRWVSGVGEGGRSVIVADIWRTQKGYSVVGRELFEGTIAGRTGSMVGWNVAFVEPDGRYAGKVFAIGGTEGLSNIRFESHYAGFNNKGGHWTAPSRMCFAD